MARPSSHPAGTDLFGYHDGVWLQVSVRPVDPKDPDGRWRITTAFPLFGEGVVVNVDGAPQPLETRTDYEEYWGEVSPI
jgi:hypothetical protein